MAHLRYSLWRKNKIMRNPSGGKQRLRRDSNRLPSEYTLEAVLFDHLHRQLCYLLEAGNRKENVSLLPAFLQLSSHSRHSNIPYYTEYQPYITLRILNLTSSGKRIRT
jgi:hypothetical protein